MYALLGSNPTRLSASTQAHGANTGAAENRPALIAARKICHNFSRIVVAILTCIGIFSTGLLANILVMVAVVLWLWLPELDDYLSHSHKIKWLIYYFFR